MHPPPPLWTGRGVQKTRPQTGDFLPQTPPPPRPALTWGAQLHVSQRIQRGLCGCPGALGTCPSPRRSVPEPGPRPSASVPVFQCAPALPLDPSTLFDKTRRGEGPPPRHCVLPDPPYRPTGWKGNTGRSAESEEAQTRDGGAVVLRVLGSAPHFQALSTPFEATGATGGSKCEVVSHHWAHYAGAGMGSPCGSPRRRGVPPPPRPRFYSTPPFGRSFTYGIKVNQPHEGRCASQNGRR